MKGAHNSETRYALLKRYLGAAAVAWTIVVGSLMVWEGSRVRQVTRDLAINEARAHFERDQAFRLWATTHGGFYVPIDDRTPPNPYLAHVSERDIETPSGKLLTLMNPAYALRQMNEDFNELYGVAGHITSLNPLRPENAADDWERAALEAFEGGETEVREFTEVGGEPHLRLMRPMLTQEGCLKCHGHQGYQVGDVRGGVGVSVPLESYLIKERETIATQTLSLGVLWLMGLAGIGWGAHGLGQRIQEHDQGQRALQEEKEEKEAVLRSVGDAIMVSDREMRIQYINPAFTNLTGYTAEEVLGQHACSIGAAAGSEQVRSSIESALTEGKQWQGEASGQRKDGRIYDAALIVSPLRDTEGNLAGSVASHRDISQRKRLERARSRFMTHVSHELRTPLSNLKLYAHLLQRGQRPEKTEHYLQVLVGQTERLEELIQDMLEMTLLDSGQALAEWKSVALSAVIADAVTRHQSRAEASDLTLEAMPVPTDLPEVIGDRSRLLQALSEVVENAVTFTAAGGQVAVEAAVVKEEGEHWVTIVVRDTGPGISREEQERVFDRFYRGKLAESGHIPGTGLGLSIAQEILRAHGGRVTVESKEGEGSAFTLWLRGVRGGEAEKREPGQL